MQDLDTSGKGGPPGSFPGFRLDGTQTISNSFAIFYSFLYHSALVVLRTFCSPQLACQLFTETSGQPLIITSNNEHHDTLPHQHDALRPDSSMSLESSNIDIDQANFNNSYTENVDAGSDMMGESRRITGEQPDSAKELQDVKAELDLYEMKLKALPLVLASREAENKTLEAENKALEVENKTLREEVKVSDGRLEYAQEALEAFFILCANEPIGSGMVGTAAL
jgi:hypothetical protein